MTNSLKTLMMGTALTSQLIHGGLLRSSRRLSTKHCGADAISAYFSCSSVTLCVTSDDCDDGEGCFEISCPIAVQAQVDLPVDEKNDIVSSDNVNNNTDTAVSCGDHTASTCSECPMGNGETWCNDDCRWDDSTDTCVEILLDPTVSPTRLNTTSPSSSPITSQPNTQAPSRYPSGSPSGNPSDIPSDAGSVAPSDSPSISPSITEIATPLPTTLKPTTAPTTSPTTPLNNMVTNSTTPTTSPIMSSSPTWSPTVTPTRFTTASPTTSPTLTYQNWTNFNYNHQKFCGPKVVGGYNIALSTCGPLTICGLSQTTSAYGTSGNDCPKNFMCYSDITCGNGPTVGENNETQVNTTNATEVALASGSTIEEEKVNATTTTTTIIVEESTTVPEAEVTSSIESTTTNSGEIIMTALEPTTTTTATTTTETITTTQPPNPIFLTTRAAFCGSFYAAAVHSCGLITMCSSSNDCPENEECFENVSCTYDPNEVLDTGSSGGGETEDVKDDNGRDKIMETGETTTTTLEDEDRLQFGQNWETLPDDSNSAVGGKRAGTFSVFVVVLCGTFLA